jgi:hypothetical protein
MAQSVTIWHNGAVMGQVPSPVPSGPSLADTLNTSFSGTYAASKATRLSVVGATDLAPYTVVLDSVTKARFLGIRVINGSSIKALLTSPSGTDQAIKVSSLLLWHSPNSGDEITAIKLVGTADIELLIAGDVS